MSRVFGFSLRRERDESVVCAQAPFLRLPSEEERLPAMLQFLFAASILEALSVSALRKRSSFATPLNSLKRNCEPVISQISRVNDPPRPKCCTWKKLSGAAFKCLRGNANRVEIQVKLNEDAKVISDHAAAHEDVHSGRRGEILARMHRIAKSVKWQT